MERGRGDERSDSARRRSLRSSVGSDVYAAAHRAAAGCSDAGQVVIMMLLCVSQGLTVIVDQPTACHPNDAA